MTLRYPRNIIVIITVLLFFIFLFYFYVKSWLKMEGFDTYDQSKTNISFLANSVPMDLAHTNLKYYNDTWNNSLTIPSSFTSTVVSKTNCDWKSYVERYSLVGIDTRDKAWDHWNNTGKAENKKIEIIKSHTVVNDSSKEIIYWADLPFDTNFPVESKLSDCSVSFWLYLNQVGGTTPWQQIFRVSDMNNPAGSIGIWLWSSGTPCIHVLRNSDPLPVNMNNNSASDFVLPVRRSVFCTLIFSGTTVVFFLNGVKKGTLQSTSAPPAYNTKRKTIEVGFANSKKAYALKDVNIYKNAMGDETVSALYDRIKNNDRTTKAESFFSNTETFTTINGGSSTYEPFGTEMIILPSEIILDNKKPFNFYAYQPISASGSSPQQGAFNVPTPMLPQNIPKITLNKNDYNIPVSMPLYYFNFDSSKKQYIDIPESIKFSDKGCTFALWFKADNNNVRWTRLFDFGKNAGNENIVLAFLNNSLQFYVFDGSRGVHQAENWAFNGTDVWYHIAWTMSPAPENVWRIYINGALYKSISNRNDPNSYEQITTPGSVSLSYSYYTRRQRRTRQETLKTNSDTNKLEIADMANTSIGYNAKVITVAKNTRVSLYTSTNFVGDPIVIEYPNSIGHLDTTVVKSIKIEKILNQVTVERSNQYIGRSNWHWDDYYSGSIGDFRIFNEVLGDSEIRHIYENPKNPETPTSS